MKYGEYDIQTACNIAVGDDGNTGIKVIKVLKIITKNEIKFCCKCNGSVDVKTKYGKLWYCHDCYRIKFCTNDKKKKYRDWFVWSTNPINEKPF